MMHDGIGVKFYGYCLRNVVHVGSFELPICCWNIRKIINEMFAYNWKATLMVAFNILKAQCLLVCNVVAFPSNFFICLNLIKKYLGAMKTECQSQQRIFHYQNSKPIRTVVTNSPYHYQPIRRNVTYIVLFLPYSYTVQFLNDLDQGVKDCIYM